MKKKGVFITVEGIEGVGKSTNLEFVRNHLITQGQKVTMTREPGGTPLGEEMRALLLDTEYSIASDTELLLMFAARAQHLAELIKPELEMGRWVVCDRFTDATYAYQGGGRGISSERIAQLERWVQGDLRPNLTLLLDAPPELGLARAASRGKAADRFEQEQIAFFDRIRNRYLAMAEQEPNRIKVIDASQSLDEVKQQLNVVLAKFLRDL